MKTMKSISLPPFALGLAGALLLAPPAVVAQGMPPAARDNIHRLFDQHDQVRRTVRLTKDGYEATTTSTNAAIAATLKAHVSQMSARLESGLMVRRWDPAFEEYVRHYADLQHEFAQLPDGIQAKVTGRTPAAVRVAQNHAQVITEFAAHGWAEHDRSHPTVAAAPVNESEAVPKQVAGHCGDCQGTSAEAAGDKKQSCEACAAKAATPAGEGVGANGDKHGPHDHHGK